jgi:hypothetical protein
MAATNNANTQDSLKFAILEYVNGIVNSGSLSDESNESLVSATGWVQHFFHDELSLLHCLFFSVASFTHTTHLELQEVAVQCMSEAFGLKLDDEECAKRLSVKPLTLPAVFKMGMQVLAGGGAPSQEEKIQRSPVAVAPTEREVRENQQRLHDEIARQQASSTSAQSSSAAESSQNRATSEDGRLFDKFLETLKARGFFAGLTEGTAEWEERLGKARGKFREKFTGAAGGAEASDAAASNNNLRDRLAEESKKMEQAEAYKAQGNQALTDKKYAEAAQCYSKAVSRELDFWRMVVFWCLHIMVCICIHASAFAHALQTFFIVFCCPQLVRCILHMFACA